MPIHKMDSLSKPLEVGCGFGGGRTGEQPALFAYAESPGPWPSEEPGGRTG